MTATDDYTEGVLYIATGDEFVQEAIQSAQSVRTALPDTPITLITDESPDADFFDDVVQVSDPEYSYADNVSYIDRSPYDRTLFLDTDTYLCADISEVFEMLDRFDVVATHDSGRRHSLYNDDGIEVNAPDSFPMYNSGVVAFRDSERVSTLFERWKAVYERHAERVDGIFNQPSFREVLYQTDVQIGTLPPEYNCRLPYPPYVRGEVKLLHGRASNFEGVAKRLNEDPITERRTFLTLAGRGDPRVVRLPLDKWQHRQRRLYESLQERGILGTLAGILRWIHSGDFL